MLLKSLFALALVLPAAQAHEHYDVLSLDTVSFEVVGEKVYVRSNGVPNHVTGQFPNRGNPNSIRAQALQLSFPHEPQKTNRKIDVRVPAIALNGVLYEPGTAECYGQSRGGMQDRRWPPHHMRGPEGRRPPPHRGGHGDGCTWHEEGIINGEGQLGMDQNNAHVQPTGLYHYHGVPTGLIAQLKPAENGFVHVGYTADGFNLYYDPKRTMRPSYKLKQGRRPGGTGNPGGTYDGTYTEDFTFDAAHGQLDACNGAELEGDEYAYFVTEAFPFAPRCLWGNVDASFNKRGPR